MKKSRAANTNTGRVTTTICYSEEDAVNEGGATPTVIPLEQLYGRERSATSAIFCRDDHFPWTADSEKEQSPQSRQEVSSLDRIGEAVSEEWKTWRSELECDSMERERRDEFAVKAARFLYSSPSLQRAEVQPPLVPLLIRTEKSSSSDAEPPPPSARASLRNRVAPLKVFFRTKLRLVPGRTAARNDVPMDDWANLIQWSTFKFGSVASDMYDDYGFSWPKDPDARNSMSNFIRLERKCLDSVHKSWLDQIRTDPYLTDKSKVKKLIRSGVPDSLRSFVWSTCLGAIEIMMRNRRLYQAFLEQPVPHKVHNQITLDVPRTFPSHQMYMSPRGRRRLYRLLHAFAAYSPTINYCQSINFIAATLLLFLPEELAFWTLVQMIDSRLEHQGMKLGGYYEAGMFSLRRDLRVLEVLVRKRCPKLFQSLQDKDIQLEWLCSDWFLCLFINTVPLQTVLRIWDSAVLEGSKIFFRVALALFKHHEKSICLSRSFEDVVKFFKYDIAHPHLSAVPTNELFEDAFSGIGTLRRKEIQKERELQTAWLRADDSERRARGMNLSIIHSIDSRSQEKSDSIWSSISRHRASAAIGSAISPIGQFHTPLEFSSDDSD